MSENLSNINTNDNSTVQASQKQPSAITPEYILEKISEVSRNSEHISKLYNMIGNIDCDFDDYDIAEQLSEISGNLCALIHEHEQTNRQIISLYEKMYDDMMYQKRVDIITQHIQEELKEEKLSIDSIIGKSFPATYLDNVKINSGRINLDELERAYRAACRISSDVNKYYVKAPDEFSCAPLDKIVDKSFMEYYFQSVKLTNGHVNLDELESAYKAACRISAVAKSNISNETPKEIDKSFMDFYFENVRATNGHVNVNDLEKVYKITYMIVG